ncbi:hypothetical protein ACQ4PT_009177 [Festuca glaucescens]
MRHGKRAPTAAPEKQKKRSFLFSTVVLASRGINPSISCRSPFHFRLIRRLRSSLPPRPYPRHFPLPPNRGGETFPFLLLLRRGSDSDGGAQSMSEESGRPLPKFGEWDVNDPASADGFTVIFNKARDEKKAGNGQDTESPCKDTRTERVESYATKANSKKWFCCVTPSPTQS